MCLLIPFKISSFDHLRINNCINDIKTHNDSINSKLQIIYDWLVVNKLSLNTSKTKYMIFHFPQRKITNDHIPDLIINNKSLTKVEKFKFLGIHLDSNLTWGHHINEISKKNSKTVGILSILKHYIPTHILLMLYNSFILSHLNFGITLWGFGNCVRLKTLQKKL